jgi:hypothetical protein
MRRVITVNLGGNAFALDEDAYERLRAYINVTESRLGRDPARTELLGDLERAVAERLATERSTADPGVVSDEAMASALGSVATVETGGHSGADHSAELSFSAPAGPSERAQESEFTRLVIMLLCFFFGWLGVHRFFVGKTGTGVLQLVTLGGLTIWAFIDFIIILCGEFKDSDGRKIVRWT